MEYHQVNFGSFTNKDSVSPQMASATICGSLQYRFITGTVRLYQTNSGVVVYSEIGGLPTSDMPCKSRIFGFHIHEGRSCSGDIDDPFSNAMAHYNPGGCSHPHHAGDLPVLFGNNGFAFSIFLTNRFTVSCLLYTSDAADEL